MRATRIGILALAATLLAITGCNRGRDSIGKDLKSERPEIRAGAVKRLADLHDEQDLPVFIARSQDHSAMVRKEAAAALGASKDTRAIDVLGTLLGDPDEEVQVVAAQALAGFPGDKAHSYLTSAFSRRGTGTRAAIAKAFGYGPALQDAIRKEADGLWDRNIKALESGSEAERVAAAEELGRSGRAQAVERLIPLLGNDAILLGAGAARGLGAAGDSKAVPPLMAVLKENYPALREAAAQALGEIGDPQALPILTTVATGADAAGLEAAAALTRLPRTAETDAALCQVVGSSANPVGAGVAARAMAERGGCPLQPLLAKLGKGPAETRTVLVALAALDAGKNEVVAKVAPLVDDKDAAVRLAAVQALGAVGDPSAGPALAKLVQAETARLAEARTKWIKDPLPKTYAPHFMPPGAAADTAFQNKLKTLEDKVRMNNAAKASNAGQTVHEAKASKEPEVVPDVAESDGQLLAAATAALGRSQAPEAQALLEPLAADSDDQIREGALTGLAYLGGPANLTKIQSAWADLSPDAVARISEALRRVGNAAVACLQAGLAARTTDRAPIALALGKLGAAGAIEPLEKLLKSPGEEAAAAAVALGQLGQVRSVKPLSELLKDPRTAGHVEAIEALGKIKDPSSREALTRELFSDRPETRAAAVRAIAALGAGTTGHELEALRADYYRVVRHAVDQALGAPGVPAR